MTALGCEAEKLSRKARDCDRFGSQTRKAVINSVPNSASPQKRQRIRLSVFLHSIDRYMLGKFVLEGDFIFAEFFRLQQQLVGIDIALFHGGILVYCEVI